MSVFGELPVSTIQDAKKIALDLEQNINEVVGRYSSPENELKKNRLLCGVFIRAYQAESFISKSMDSYVIDLHDATVYMNEIHNGYRKINDLIDGRLFNTVPARNESGSLEKTI
jgi:hypothetical protein